MKIAKMKRIARTMFFSKLRNSLIMLAFISFPMTSQTLLPEKFPYPFRKNIQYDRLQSIEKELSRKTISLGNTKFAGLASIDNFLHSGATPSFPINSPNADDIYWDDQFTLPGVEGVVYCMAMNDEGALYIGGTFSVVGTLQTHNIAKWDGEQWQPLGNGVTGTWVNINPSVRALLFDGDDLYVAGEFRYAGGEAAQNIARWDGNQWNALGNDTCNGLGEYIVALAKIDTNLYVGGNFSHVCTPEGNWIPSNGIARWDGHAWHPIGHSLNPGARIFAMAVFDTILYAGGFILEAGGQPVRHVVSWDGYRWAPVGNGVNHVVYSMAVDDNSNIYVGGTFTEAGGIPARYIAKWDGNQWLAVGSGNPGEGPNDGVIAIFPDGDDLYVGGHFTKISGDTMLHIAKWDGSSWSPLGSGLDQISWLGPSPAVNCILKGENGLLYAGGGFVQAGQKAVNHLGIWDGTEWSTITEGGGQGVNGPVITLAADSEGNIYAGGELTCAGDIAANHVARWDGERWYPLGKGIEPRGGGISPVLIISTAVDNSVYVGGYFVKAGDVQANNIARWDGTRWHTLGDGPSNGINDGWVDAIGVSKNEIYAGGQFLHAGNNYARNIAKWDGIDWASLGSGIGKEDESVLTITIIGDRVYAGGTFTEAGGDSAGRIAGWDGNNWYRVGNGISFAPGVGVRTIEPHDNDIYVGGMFPNVDTLSIKNITYWDGNQWFALDNGIDGTVWKIGFNHEKLFAGGWFYAAGGDSANGIARWDGTSWSSLGNGVQGRLYNAIDAMALGLVVHEKDVYVGGTFTLAGKKPSYCFARWSEPPTGVISKKKPPTEYILEQNYPNPFNTTTSITFHIPAGIDLNTSMTLRVYNVLGEEVATILKQALLPGRYTIRFEADKLSSGIYYYRLTAGGHSAVKRMILLR